MEDSEKAFDDFVADFYANEPATLKQIDFIDRIATGLAICKPKNPTKLQAQKWIGEHIDTWHTYCEALAEDWEDAYYGDDIY